MKQKYMHSVTIMMCQLCLKRNTFFRFYLIENQPGGKLTLNIPRIVLKNKASQNTFDLKKFSGSLFQFILELQLKNYMLLK